MESASTCELLKVILKQCIEEDEDIVIEYVAALLGIGMWCMETFVDDVLAIWKTLNQDVQSRMIRDIFRKSQDSIFFDVKFVHLVIPILPLDAPFRYHISDVHRRLLHGWSNYEGVLLHAIIIADQCEPYMLESCPTDASFSLVKCPQHLEQISILELIILMPKWNSKLARLALANGHIALSGHIRIHGERMIELKKVVKEQILDQNRCIKATKNELKCLKSEDAKKCILSFYTQKYETIIEKLNQQIDED